MNAIRTVMSLFLVWVLALSVAGWVWAGGQPSPKLEGARAVLALCILIAAGGMVLIWRVKPRQAK